MWFLAFGICVGGSLGLAAGGDLEGVVLMAMAACFVVGLYMLEGVPEEA